MFIEPLSGPVMLKLSTVGTVVDEDGMLDEEEEDIDWTDSVDSSNDKITLSVDWKVFIVSFRNLNSLPYPSCYCKLVQTRDFSWRFRC
jgi:hypothetical protein